MNRSRTVRLIFAALAVAILIVVAIGLPGDARPSIGEAADEVAVTRLPRPHPISHLSLPPGMDLLNPRPHPTSHIGLALNRQ
jgi:hypothetical protein